MAGRAHNRLMHLLERWFRLLLRLYPADFRDEMGHAIVDEYRDRARAALDRARRHWIELGVLPRVARFVRNGLDERMRPAASWRRSGNWGHDLELTRRRLVRCADLRRRHGRDADRWTGHPCCRLHGVDTILLERLSTLSSPFGAPD